MRRTTTPGAALTGGCRPVRRRGFLSRHREPLPTRVDDTPPLPPAYHEAVDAGLTELGLALQPAAREAIDGHLRLLLAWTVAINLTAIREPVEAARLHVLDALTAVEPLRQLGVTRFVDLGSGGGLPGLPLAAALPAERTLLVESVAKKAAFLEVAAHATGLDDRVAVAAERAEGLATDPRDRAQWHAVTARAVAPLAELVELSFPLLARDGVLVAWKRDLPDDERAAAEGALRGLGGDRLEVHDPGLARLPGHRLVIARKTRTTPDQYPRDPATRRRRPW